jgi:hypothetical protein
MLLASLLLPGWVNSTENNRLLHTKIIVLRMQFVHVLKTNDSTNSARQVTTMQ